MDAHATLLITKINQHVNKDWVENKLLKAVALSLNSVECRRTINKAAELPLRDSQKPQNGRNKVIVPKRLRPSSLKSLIPARKT